jgi:hypothetical protein
VPGTCNSEFKNERVPGLEPLKNKEYEGFWLKRSPSRLARAAHLLRASRPRSRYSVEFEHWTSLKRGYGQGAGVVALLRATGAVVGLLKSAELLLVSVQLTVRITERAFELVAETEIGAFSKQFAVLP